jgi:hypothetical protein
LKLSPGFIAPANWLTEMTDQFKSLPQNQNRSATTKAGRPYRWINDFGRAGGHYGVILQCGFNQVLILKSHIPSIPGNGSRKGQKNEAMYQETINIMEILSTGEANNIFRRIYRYSGIITASLILQRLFSYPHQPRLGRALREKDASNTHLLCPGLVAKFDLTPASLFRAAKGGTRNSFYGVFGMGK